MTSIHAPLKKCPFCGSIAAMLAFKLKNREQELFQVTCTNDTMACQLEPKTYPMLSPELAIAAWNMRVP